MKIFVPKETTKLETRVAASTDTVKKLIAHGFDVHVGKGAGVTSGITDQAFKDAGAKIATAKSAGEADVILRVQRPTAAESKKYKAGAIVLAMLAPAWPRI